MGGIWAADLFDSAVEDADEAHIDSCTYDSLEEALRDLLPFTPKP